MARRLPLGSHPGQYDCSNLTTNLPIHPSLCVCAKKLILALTLNLLQFNVGQHFHSDNMTLYAQNLIQVVTRLREHSPGAHIVFALTTPSPFDSANTIPNRTTCSNYDRFFKAGHVSMLNKVAEQTLEPLGAIINDRYAAIHPRMGAFQTIESATCISPPKRTNSLLSPIGVYFPPFCRANRAMRTIKEMQL